jgi:hypothetical protein
MPCEIRARIGTTASNGPLSPQKKEQAAVRPVANDRLMFADAHQELRFQNGKQGCADSTFRRRMSDPQSSQDFDRTQPSISIRFKIV